jgi:hypothetical protein
MTKLENLCIKWLNENFNPMEPFIMEEHPDYIFHMKDGKCILQYNKKNGKVFVSYREIWKFFESYFSMSNQQIKDITKIWVEEYYKMGVTTTTNLQESLSNWVEEYYKVGVTTTGLIHQHHLSQVEEHYKMRVTTTLSDFGNATLPVEKQYKEIQTTNNQLQFYSEKDVEELYEQKTNGK